MAPNTKKVTKPAEEAISVVHRPSYSPKQKPSSVPLGPTPEPYWMALSSPSPAATAAADVASTSVSAPPVVSPLPSPAIATPGPQPSVNVSGVLPVASPFTIEVVAGGKIGPDKDGTGTAAVVAYNGTSSQTDLTGMAFEPGKDAPTAFWYVEQGFYNKLRRVAIPGGEVTSPLVHGPDLDEIHPIGLPAGLVSDPVRGVFYLADASNNRILKITPAGDATVLVGKPGIAPLVDSADGAPTFNYPTGLALAGDILYVAEANNHTIRKIDLAASGGPVVTTLAGGKGLSGTAENDVDGTAARFNQPEGIAIGVAADGSQVLFVADCKNNCIRAIDLATKRVTIVAGLPGKAGNVDGGNQSATFDAPVTVVADGLGNVYVGESGGSAHRLRMINEKFVTSTLAGTAGGVTDTTGFQVLLGLLGVPSADGSISEFYAYDLGPPSMAQGAPGPRILRLVKP